jgi:hypothetical protein
MAWDGTKATNDIVSSSDYNDSVTDQKTRAIRTNGAGAPSSTPSNVGDIYIDTTNLKIYISTGTSSSADWKKVISQ